MVQNCNSCNIIKESNSKSESKLDSCSESKKIVKKSELYNRYCLLLTLIINILIFFIFIFIIINI